MATCSYCSMGLLIMFNILFFHSSFPVFAALEPFNVPSGGPESYAFDINGEGFYTGVNDGRIVYYAGPDVGFVDFAYASPKRTKELCDGTDGSDPGLAYTCGRVLGLAFDYNTNKLYIADAYHGLNVVGLEGGLATQVADSADGLPFKWLDGLGVDQTTGYVYFADVSSVYNLSQVDESITSGDATGRFMVYDPNTKSTRVLLTNLTRPGGVEASADGSFALFSEFPANRITKYWLRGPKAGTAELILNISGPSNLKLLPSGNFWVAVNNQTSGANVPTGVKIDGYGNILETLPFPGSPYNGAFITEAQEHKGYLFTASVFVPFGAVGKLPGDLKEILTPGMKKSEWLSSY